MANHRPEDFAAPLYDFSGSFAPNVPHDTFATGTTRELKLFHSRTEWQFPKDRFTTYEPSDELWARPLGFGREVEIVETLTIPQAVIEYRDGSYVFRGMIATAAPPLECSP